MKVSTNENSNNSNQEKDSSNLEEYKVIIFFIKLSQSSQKNKNIFECPHVGCTRTFKEKGNMKIHSWTHVRKIKIKINFFLIKTSYKKLKLNFINF